MAEDKDCIFCKIVKGDVKSEKIFESENFIAIKDIRKIVGGHSLVIPKKHFENLLDMPSSLYREFLEAVQESAVKLMEQEKAGGFNIAMNNFKVSGQAVPHAHIHILPRKEGDKLELKIGKKIV